MCRTKQNNGEVLRSTNHRKAGYIIFLNLAFAAAGRPGASPDLRSRPQLLPSVGLAEDLLLSVESSDRSPEQAHLVENYVKYSQNTIKIAKACKKAKALCDGQDITLVEDVLDSEGNVDFHRTHHDFQLRQVNSVLDMTIFMYDFII